jgi:hypothetical protein
VGRGFNQTHNEQASVVALARTMLQSIDRAQVESRVATASLELVLQTVIALGSASKQVDLRTNIHEQQIGTQFEAVAKARQEIARKQELERENAARELED